MFTFSTANSLIPFPFFFLEQASLASDYSASINRVTWSPDGNLFGSLLLLMDCALFSILMVHFW